VNPAEPPVQLLGVADPRLLEPVAQVLLALGVAQAMVVHGAGLDEVALHDSTEAVRLDQGRLERLTLSPELAGIEAAPLAGLRGGSPEENAERLKALLFGYGTSAECRAVALNAGALLLTAGQAPTLRDGVDLALQTIGSGGARRVLEAAIELSHA
jgi:anthranilate phosphoribosyltransferase